MRPPSMPSMPALRRSNTPSMPATPTTPAGLPTPATAANDLSQGFTKASPPAPAIRCRRPFRPPRRRPLRHRHLARIRPGLRSATGRGQQPCSQPHAAARSGGVSGHSGTDDRRPAAGNLAAFGSDLPKGPPPVNARHLRRGGPGGPPPLPRAAAAGISSGSVPPGALAASGIAATGTGAAMVCSETQDQYLDQAVQLAYELLHASRMYPGPHRRVGIFKNAAGTETVIVSNDGASYIHRASTYPVPPERFSPTPIQMLASKPSGSAGSIRRRQWLPTPPNTRFWIPTSSCMRSPPQPTRAARPSFPPDAPGRRIIRTATRRARRSNQPRRTPELDETDYTASPSFPHSATNNSPTPICLPLNAIRRPGRQPQAPSQQRSPARNPSASKSRRSSAGSGCPRERLHPSRTSSGPRSPKYGCMASPSPCAPGSSRSSRPATQHDRVVPAHHNLDRAVEALSLWRGDNPDFAEIVYATEQITKEEQLWPSRI